MKAKEKEILDFLGQHIFEPILSSDKATNSLKQGVRYTIMRLKERDAEGMVSYYWSAIIGTEKSSKFAKQMKKEGFTRFEEMIDEFRDRFNGKWLRK